MSWQWGFTAGAAKKRRSSSLGRSQAQPAACTASTTSPCTTRSTKGFEIEFRALLNDGAQEEVRFERVAAG